MSEDLLYDKKDIVPDDSGLMKRKGIEPYRNVVISDENGNELLEAYLDYVGSKIIVIQLLSIWDAKKLEGKSLLYFKSLERYDQVYKEPRRKEDRRQVVWIFLRLHGPLGHRHRPYRGGDGG